MFAQFWEILVASWSRPGAMLAQSWRIFVVSWCFKLARGGVEKYGGGPRTSCFIKSCNHDSFCDLLAHLGPFLAPCWHHFGGFLSHLEAILGHAPLRKTIPKTVKKKRKLETIPKIHCKSYFGNPCLSHAYWENPFDILGKIGFSFVAIGFSFVNISYKTTQLIPNVN